MQIVSVNVGEPREVSWRGRQVESGIFKQPVEGPVAVRRLGLDGDRQADLRVHGGRHKAVYAYPAEHYAYWREELGRDLPYGMFGENLTVADGPLEDDIHIGDRVRAGTAALVVTQPRLPCFKLGIKFGTQHMLKRFLRSGRTGYYLRVDVEGTVAAGDEIVVERDATGVPVSEVTRLFTDGRHDVDALRRMLAAAALPPDWREWFERALREATAAPVANASL